eukprot:3091755-Pyramimonas_sp.AAC.1
MPDLILGRGVGIQWRAARAAEKGPSRAPQGAPGPDGGPVGLGKCSSLPPPIPSTSSFHIFRPPRKVQNDSPIHRISWTPY